MEPTLFRMHPRDFTDWTRIGCPGRKILTQIDRYFLIAISTKKLTIACHSGCKHELVHFPVCFVVLSGAMSKGSSSTFVAEDSVSFSTIFPPMPTRLKHNCLNKNTHMNTHLPRPNIVDMHALVIRLSLSSCPLLSVCTHPLYVHRSREWIIQ